MNIQDIIYTITGCILAIGTLTAFFLWLFYIGKEEMKLSKDLKKTMIKYYKSKTKFYNIDNEDDEDKKEITE